MALDDLYYAEKEVKFEQHNPEVFFLLLLLLLLSLLTSPSVCVRGATVFVSACAQEREIFFLLLLLFLPFLSARFSLAFVLKIDDV